MEKGELLDFVGVPREAKSKESIVKENLLSLVIS